MNDYGSLFEVSGLSEDQAEFLRLQAASKERKLTKEEELRYVQLSVKLRSQSAGANVDDSGLSDITGLNPSKALPQKDSPAQFGNKAEGSLDGSRDPASFIGEKFGQGALTAVKDAPRWVWYLAGGAAVVLGTVYIGPIAATVKRISVLKGRRR